MVAKAFALITTVIPAGLIPLTRDRERDTMPNSANISEMAPRFVKNFPELVKRFYFFRVPQG